MTDERKKIIIEEITYWKDHKLLPEEQCDFLLALYTQGKGKKYFLKTKYDKIFMIYLILLILLIPLSVIVTYFTKLSLKIKLSLLIFFLLYAYFSFMLFKRYRFVYTNIALLTVLTLVLFITVYVTNYFATHQLILPFIILSNFFIWYIIGKYQRIKLLRIISIISFVFTCFYIIFQFT